jgi:cardiolipin synthase
MTSSDAGRGWVETPLRGGAIAGDTVRAMVGRRSGRPRVFTVPNLLSLLRIALVPVVYALIVGDGTEAAGLVLFGVVASTDWVDGYLARRTGKVTELGKVLDPVADRLAIAAALVAVVVRDAFPLWAAIAIIARDVLVVVGGAVVFARRGVRIDVRRSGKAATLLLMIGVPLVAWGAFELPLAPGATVLGWACYAVGIVLYYWTTLRYAADLRAALSAAEAPDER